MLRPLRLLPAAGLAVLALAVAAPAGSAAGDREQAYRQAVDQALQIVRGADRAHPSSAAVEAATVLRAGTGTTQPEILRDLESGSPDLDGAEKRLSALDEALARPAAGVDAGRARSEIDRILAQRRYDSMRSGSSIIQQIEDYLLRLLLEVILFLLSRAGSVPGRLLALLVGLAVAALAGWLVWELRRRAGRDAVVATGPPRERSVRDFFAEADRLAAEGDYRRAVIALAGGVADAVAGDEAWDRSSLTVRELFRRASRPEGLRPLLLAFEGSSYGQRQPSPSEYLAAAQAAAPFRVAAP